MVENSEDLKLWTQEQVMSLGRYICATASFGLKMRIEKVGRNRERATVSNHRQLCFS